MAGEGRQGTSGRMGQRTVTKAGKEKTEWRNTQKKKLAEEDTVKLYSEAMKLKVSAGQSLAAQLPGISLTVVSRPSMAAMVTEALAHMDVAGAGCTKLEILLYILRTFLPPGDISALTSSMLEVLEQGTEQGSFLSTGLLDRAGQNEQEIPARTEAKGGKKQVFVKVILDDRKKRVKMKNIKKEGKNGKSKAKKKECSQPVRKLREPLSTICKAKKLPWNEVLRRIWTYIRVKKLQNPKDKSSIMCDDKLRELTNTKEISMATLPGYLRPFIQLV